MQHPTSDIRRRLLGLALAIPCAASFVAKVEGATQLGIRDESFTVNGKPAFLIGMSLYGALGEEEGPLRRDLDEIARSGFNWIRVWATWSAYSKDVSAVDGSGGPRPVYLERLRKLVEDCDRRGLVVDVTLCRGKGGSGPSNLEALPAHRRAVETIVGALKPLGNWYLDLSNERNIRDARYTSFEDLAELRELVRRLDPRRLVTASHGGDLDREELRKYLETARVDFVTPHRPRDAGAPAETPARTRAALGGMRELGHRAPLLYQEPLRRGYGEFEPPAEEFLADLRAAKDSGAAGWCFHNGSQKRAPDQRPRRSFDLSEKGLFEQLDDEEKKVVSGIRALAGKQ